MEPLILRALHEKEITLAELEFIGRNAVVNPLLMRDRSNIATNDTSIARSGMLQPA